MNKLYKNYGMFQFAKQLLITLPAALILSNSLLAADGPEKTSGVYIGVGGNKAFARSFKSAGFTYPNSKAPGNNIMPTAVIGYRFNKFFRTDLNAQMRKFHYSGGQSIKVSQKINNYTAFLNAYLDIPNYTVFAPYA